MKRSDKQKLMAAAIFAAFGGVMYLKNRMMPKYADDYPYSFIWEGEEHGNLAYGNHRYRRVKTVRDLVKSQISHYKTWDGRAIAESLVQIFLIPDKKKAFDVANTAVVLSQIAICAGLSRSRKTRRLAAHKKALSLVAGFWSCAPHLAASCLWLTGSMNYLWMGVLQSAFVLQYSKKYHDPSYRIPVGAAALLGLLAGWTTETGAGAALMLSAMEIIYAGTKKEIEGWMAAGFCGCMAGVILLMLAPGNRVKYGIEREYSNTLPTDVDDRFPGYLPDEYLYTPFMFKAYFKEGFLPTVKRELPLQVPVLIYLLNRKCRTPEADLYIAALEAAALAIPSVMLLSPEYPVRAAYPSVIYLLAAAAYALEQTGDEVFPYNNKWFGRGSLAVCGLVAVSAFSSILVDADFGRQMADEIELLKKDKSGRKQTMMPVMPPPIYSFFAGDRSIDLINCMGLGDEEEYDPYNKATAAYYGTGDFSVDYEADHPYEDMSIKGIRYQLVQPVRSFIRRISELIH